MYYYLNLGWIVIGVSTFVLLLFVTAPYGRHSREGWGPALQARWGWVLMEGASPVAFALFFLIGNRSLNPVTAVFFILWILHYANRSVLYPLRMKHGERPMVLSVAVMGLFFNFVNAYLNGTYLNLFGDRYGLTWILDPRFLIGIALFAGGMLINLHSDGILRRMRGEVSEGYRIPRGGAFELVSCANYLGEIVEWSGWAVMTWSLPGLTFALWTAANLVPRALAHHRWYQKQFPNYPDERKAIIPYIL
jgi:3-oxo-5-alpha-steroid 4-dehydrogenase 1